MTLNIPNLDRLISHLEGLPEEKFDMRSVFQTESDDNVSWDEFHWCGTVACVAGWCLVLSNIESNYSTDAADWLGLDLSDHGSLFMPQGYDVEGEYPLSRAVRTLKHMRSEYLRTGQVVVDWDAPEPVTKAAWVPPHATERKLPIEIVRFLSPADLEVSA